LAVLYLKRLVASFHRGGLGSSRNQVMCFCGGQSGVGAGFLGVLPFPLSIIPPTAPHIIIRCWNNRPNNDLCTKWTQSHPTPRKTSFLADHVAPSIRKSWH
jgi:hypothetical protein